MGMLNIDNGSKRRIYAIAASLGMVQGHDHEDPLHLLVQGLTGKEGISDLTPAERQLVEQELIRRKARQHQGTQPRQRRKRKYEEMPGGVTAAQQGKIWYLMGELATYDPKPGVSLQARLCGMIEKQFHVTAFPAQPCRFLTREQGAALIEGLKQQAERAELEYLHSAKYRSKQGAAYGQ